jgi:phosphatidylserine decarboxylase
MSAVTFVAAQILRMLPRARISHAVGRLADQPLAPPVERAVVGLYSRVYDVTLDDCAQKSDFRSFDAFFTRTLRKGARAVDPDPTTVVSPADGRVDSMARIDGQGTFLVKGRPYRVDELVGDGVAAARLRGGAGFVVYLSPRDYHRVHAPVAGKVKLIRSMPGDYYPVNAVGMRHVPSLFCRNRRVAIEIDGGPRIGNVTVVMVVAMIVGRVTTIGVSARDVPLGVHAFDPPLYVERGDEIGVFHLGSTAVVLVEERAAGAWLRPVGPVRYGERLLQVAAPRSVANGPTGGENGINAPALPADPASGALR